MSINMPTADISILTTSEGIRFGIYPAASISKCAPTLFVLAHSIETTLTKECFNRVGMRLAAEGTLVVSIDLPCHGLDVLPGESAELKGWQERLISNYRMFADFAMHFTCVLDHLLRRNWSDPGRLAVAGTSRGAFAGFHAAARERRLQSLIAFSPLIDLRKLSEFNAVSDDKRIISYDINGLVSELTGRSVFLCIGNCDRRVGTEPVLAFNQHLVEANSAAGLDADVTLHVMPWRGHTTPLSLHDEAADWLRVRWGI